MKKLFFVMMTVGMVAAGCSSSQQVTTADKVSITPPPATVTPSASSIEGDAETILPRLCQDAQLGVQFQYPEGWHIWKTSPPNGEPVLVSSCDGDTSHLVFTPTKDFEGPKAVSNFRFITNQGMNAAEKGQRFFGVTSADDIAAVLKKSTVPFTITTGYTAGGEKAVRWTAEEHASAISWVHGGVVYELDIRNLDDTTLAKILATVRFTK